jgi:ATP-dependent exoDNAse (exonuclease V) beta subunit
MAVILRSPGAGIAAITRAFALNGIPLDVDAQAMALGENPAIRPLLQIAQIALGDIALTPANWEIIEELLKSEFAGADSLSLRTMRIELSKVRTEGDLRTSTEMMLSAIIEPVTEFSDIQITPLLRLNELIAIAKKTLRTSTNVSDLLWAIWSNAKDIDGASIPTLWRNRALAGGVRGAAADRDLDAVMQLFESARRFIDRLPFAKPSQFISQVMGETILGDAITSRAARDEVVSVMTVHSAKGAQWQVVAIMGLQEGIWPNLRQRGSLLGSERLVESMRSGLTARDQIEASAASALIEDERRLLHVAITRAQSQLVVTAYREEDSEPSPYFEELYEAVHGTTSEDIAPLELPRSLTSQALVATLRRTIMDSTVSEIRRTTAASLLQSLGVAGIESANPDNWLGISALSTTAPVIAPDQTVSVSPSNLQSFSECGLKWFIERSGGRDGDSSAQLIGSAIHALASLILSEPTLTIEDMKSRLADNWKVINANSGWVKDYEFNQAYDKLSKFFAWHAKSDRTLIGVEERFEVMIGRARLNGSVDRIEIDMEGRVFIIDLKTGASDTSREDAQSHRQLQGYQVAVIEGAFENKDLPGMTQKSGGAELIYLGGKEKSASVKTQDPIDLDAVKAEIETAAEAMAANTFVATINDRCRTCGVKSLCPLQSEGRAVIDQ